MDFNKSLGAKDAAACGFWPRGECRYGAKCSREHHPALDPALRASRAHDYDVPNEVNVACERCLALGRVCDKLGRDADKKDPCSECRQFGGDGGAPCVLAKNTSYNDSFWHAMCSQKSQDHVIAAARPRDKPKKGKVPQPMPDHMVKLGWKGKSRDELLNQPLSFIPDYVRATPRAYLVPPRPTHAELSNERHFKRLREEEADTGGPVKKLASDFAQQANIKTHEWFPPAPEQSPPHPDHGEVKRIFWDYSEGMWMKIHEDGQELAGYPSDERLVEYNRGEQLY